ncbi:MAG TPA: hypothetical protein ENH19_00860 [Actinobacteria bacterium]|nr:hypothetical protein [Actinomycetes bacterium]HEX21187.1 hypothetical protein [Actinomycetota bacterium]
MPYNSGVSSSAIAALGGFFLVMMIIYIAILVISFWAYGTLLKAALGQPKVMVLLLLIPLVNIVMVIVWGFQAHNLLKEREAAESNG